MLARATDATHLRTALDTAPTAAMLVGENGSIVLTNTKLEKLFGYERHELEGQPVEMLVPEGARKHHPDLRDAFFEYPSPRSMGTGRDLYGLARSGEKIPVEIGLNPIQTETGLQVMATVLDIRERKRHEERFRRALDAAPCAILMVDSSGTIVLCNALTDEVFGYQRDELVGRPIEVLIPKRLHRKHAVYRSSYVQKPLRRSMGQGRALWGLRADGTEFPVEVALQPITTDEDEYVISSVLDVSARVAAEQEIREKNLHLTKLNEELTAFAYSTSHDLKAPLSTVRGLVQCMSHDLEANRLDEVRQNIARIETLTGKLSILIEDVLDVARADNLGGATEILRIHERIRAAIERLSQLRVDNEVVVDLSAVQACEIVSEPRRFDSIIDNLLSNAFLYADPDKSERRVEISTCLLDGVLAMDVRDNGIGIPEDMRERVFQLFERVNASGPEGKRARSRAGGETPRPAWRSGAA